MAGIFPNMSNNTENGDDGVCEHKKKNCTKKNQMLVFPPDFLQKIGFMMPPNSQNSEQIDQFPAMEGQNTKITCMPNTEMITPECIDVTKTINETFCCQDDAKKTLDCSDIHPCLADSFNNPEKEYARNFNGNDKKIQDSIMRVDKLGPKKEIDTKIKCKEFIQTSNLKTCNLLKESLLLSPSFIDNTMPSVKEVQTGRYVSPNFHESTNMIDSKSKRISETIESSSERPATVSLLTENTTKTTQEASYDSSIYKTNNFTEIVQELPLEQSVQSNFPRVALDHNKISSAIVSKHKNGPTNYNMQGNYGINKSYHEFSDCMEKVYSLHSPERNHNVTKNDCLIGMNIKHDTLCQLPNCTEVTTKPMLTENLGSEIHSQISELSILSAKIMKTTPALEIAGVSLFNVSSSNKGNGNKINLSPTETDKSTSDILTFESEELGSIHKKKESSEGNCVHITTLLPNKSSMITNIDPKNDFIKSNGLLCQENENNDVLLSSEKVVNLHTLPLLQHVSVVHDEPENNGVTSVKIKCSKIYDQFNLITPIAKIQKSETKSQLQIEKHEQIRKDSKLAKQEQEFKLEHVNSDELVEAPLQDFIVDSCEIYKQGSTKTCTQLYENIIELCNKDHCEHDGSNVDMYQDAHQLSLGHVAETVKAIVPNKNLASQKDIPNTDTALDLPLSFSQSKIDKITHLVEFNSTHKEIETDFKKLEMCKNIVIDEDTPNAIDVHDLPDMPLKEKPVDCSLIDVDAPNHLDNRYNENHLKKSESEIYLQETYKKTTDNLFSDNNKETVVIKDSLSLIAEYLKKAIHRKTQSLNHYSNRNYLRDQSKLHTKSVSTKQKIKGFNKISNLKDNFSKNIRTYSRKPSVKINKSMVQMINDKPHSFENKTLKSKILSKQRLKIDCDDQFDNHTIDLPLSAESELRLNYEFQDINDNVKGQHGDMVRISYCVGMINCLRNTTNSKEGVTCTPKVLTKKNADPHVITNKTTETILTAEKNVELFQNILPKEQLLFSNSLADDISHNEDECTTEEAELLDLKTNADVIFSKKNSGQSRDLFENLALEDDIHLCDYTLKNTDLTSGSPYYENQTSSDTSITELLKAIQPINDATYAESFQTKLFEHNCDSENDRSCSDSYSVKKNNTEACKGEIAANISKEKPQNIDLKSCVSENITAENNFPECNLLSNSVETITPNFAKTINIKSDIIPSGSTCKDFCSEFKVIANGEDLLLNFIEQKKAVNFIHCGVDNNLNDVSHVGKNTKSSVDDIATTSIELEIRAECIPKMYGTRKRSKLQKNKFREAELKQDFNETNTMSSLTNENDRKSNLTSMDADSCSYSKKMVDDGTVAQKTKMSNTNNLLEKSTSAEFEGTITHSTMDLENIRECSENKESSKHPSSKITKNVLVNIDESSKGKRRKLRNVNNSTNDLETVETSLKVITNEGLTKLSGKKVISSQNKMSFSPARSNSTATDTSTQFKTPTENHIAEKNCKKKSARGNLNGYPDKSDVLTPSSSPLKTTNITSKEHLQNATNEQNSSQMITNELNHITKRPDPKKKIGESPLEKIKISSKNSGSPQSSKCGVCLKDIDVNDWIPHCAKEHNYLAWIDGKKPIDSADTKSVVQHLQKIVKNTSELVCTTCAKKFTDALKFWDHVKHCTKQSFVTPLLEKNESLEVLDSENTEDDKIKSKENTVTCAVCSWSGEEESWVGHIFKEHGYLAWRNGDPSLDFDDELILHEHLKKLVLTLSKLTCHKCGIERKNVKTFIKHIQKCQGAEPEPERPASPTPKNDANEVLPQPQKKRRRISSESENVSLKKLKESNVQVRCACCHESVESWAWSEHLVKHDYVAWKEGDTPIDVECLKSVNHHLRAMMDLYKALACRLCGSKLTSVLGYRKHVLRCEQKSESGNLIKRYVRKSDVVLPTSQRPTTDPVKCAVCFQEMPKKKWFQHLEQIHYNLAWFEGGTPFNIMDYHTSYLILNDLIKKVHTLKCVKCGLTRMSGAGFYAHIIVCKKSREEIEAMKVPCTLCERRCLPLYLPAHLITHRRSAASNAPDTGPAATPAASPAASAGSSRRAAAVAAKANIEKITTELVQSKKSCKSCGFVSYTTKELIKHRCGAGSSRSGNLSDNDSEPDAKWESESEDSESAVDSELSGRESRSPPPLSSGGELDSYGEINRNHDKKRFKEFERTPYKPGKDDLFFSKPFYTDIVKDLPLTKEVLFPELRCGEVENLPAAEAARFMPPMARSCCLAMQIDQSEELTKWKSFALFESEFINRAHISFAGGPVTAMAWAPPADYTSCAPAEQYLAVVCGRDPDTLGLQYDRLHSHPALIQIWCFDENSFGIDHTPARFALGLAHEYGTVWAVSWCPSGGRDERAGAPHRLGLLAAACSDGSTYIFAVPHPGGLPPHSSDQPIYKVKPLLELHLCSDDHSRKNYQATALLWSMDKGHSIVCVGYSDGTVAMYDISTDSPILRRIQTGLPTIMNPYCDSKMTASSITALFLRSGMLGGEHTATVEAWAAWGAATVPRIGSGATVQVPRRFASSGTMVPLHIQREEDDMKTYGPAASWAEWVGRVSRTSEGTPTAACPFSCRVALFSPTAQLILLRSIFLNEHVKKNILCTFEMRPLHIKKFAKERAADNLEKILEPFTYKEAVNKYGIVCSTKNKIKMEGPSADCYPLTSMSCVAFCPSGRHFSQLACAGTAGLIFVRKV